MARDIAVQQFGKKELNKFSLELYLESNVYAGRPKNEREVWFAKMIIFFRYSVK